jgi:hypothetical protein
MHLICKHFNCIKLLLFQFTPQKQNIKIKLFFFSFLWSKCQDGVLKPLLSFSVLIDSTEIQCLPFSPFQPLPGCVWQVITNMFAVVTLTGKNNRHKQECERVAGVKRKQSIQWYWSDRWIFHDSNTRNRWMEKTDPQVGGACVLLGYIEVGI